MPYTIPVYRADQNEFLNEAAEKAIALAAKHDGIADFIYGDVKVSVQSGMEATQLVRAVKEAQRTQQEIIDQTHQSDSIKLEQLVRNVADVGGGLADALEWVRRFSVLAEAARTNSPELRAKACFGLAAAGYSADDFERYRSAIKRIEDVPAIIQSDAEKTGRYIVGYAISAMGLEETPDSFTLNSLIKAYKNPAPGPG